MIESLALSIGIHLSSHHWDQEPWHNNQTYGLYIRANDWQFGTYQNTFSKQSFYLAYAFRPIVQVPRLELLVGAVSGYSRTTITKTTHFEKHDDSGKVLYNWDKHTKQTVGYKEFLRPMYAIGYSEPITSNVSFKVFGNHSFINAAIEYAF